jgi:hypothetical protein
LRQRPSRYTIRAGRNLPDKEFRYLRTVIVTAAVYRGFISKLRLHYFHFAFSSLTALTMYTADFMIVAVYCCNSK